eukprot:848600-Amphidinium_carterae.1
MMRFEPREPLPARRHTVHPSGSAAVLLRKHIPASQVDSLTGFFMAALRWSRATSGQISLSTINMRSCVVASPGVTVH